MNVQLTNKKTKSAMIFTVILLIILAVVCGSATCRAHAATPYEKNGRLSISNGKVINAHNKPFVIKGVSTHGIAWYPQYINQKSFDTLAKKWKANTIRIALYTEEYGGYCSGGNKKELKNKIDQAVKYARKSGLYVIIDWHILSDGNPLRHKKQANKFFKEIAGKYAKYGNVIFEICNEPNGSGGSWKNIKKYSYSVIKTIRSVNKKAIIIVGTPTWSQDVEKPLASPIKGYKNIAYSFHFYAGTHKKDMRSRLEKALKKKLPVIVTEFGISDASGNGGINRSGGDQWIKLLNKYKTGRVCWNLSNKAESSALIKSSCSKTSGWTSKNLTASGKWLVKKYSGKSPSEYVMKKGTFFKKTPVKTPGKGGNYKAGKYISAKVISQNSWKDSGKYVKQYKLIIRGLSNTPPDTWKITVHFKNNVTLLQGWNGRYTRKTNTLTIKPVEWNSSPKKGETAELGFIVKGTYKPSVKSISFK